MRKLIQREVKIPKFQSFFSASLLALAGLILPTKPLQAELSDRSMSLKNELMVTKQMSKQVGRPNGKIPVVGFPLSQTVAHDITGMSFERRGKADTKQFLEDTLLFVKIIRGKADPGELAQYISRCLTESDWFSYCQYFTHFWLGDRISSLVLPDIAGLERGKVQLDNLVTRSQVDDAIKTRNLAVLNQATRRQLFRAFRQTDHWESIEKLGVAVMGQTQCLSTSVYSILGLKIEEFLPGKDRITLAKNLYTKAHNCAVNRKWTPAPFVTRVDQEHVELARYRLGLLHVWQNECAQADPILDYLKNEPNGKYVSRSIFWQAYCAKQRGDEVAVNLLRNQLIKENPLGYHSIAINQGKIPEISHLAYSADSDIRFRSNVRPMLNLLVKGVETLLLHDEQSSARSLLLYISPKSIGVEPEFSLYLGTLASRMSFPIQSFRFLSRTFAQDPTLVSSESLKLYYPLKFLSTINQYKNKVDPYLVVSLIRQESGFVEHARSPVGALGLMQLMPATARRMARVKRWQLLRKNTNIRLGVEYFRQLLNRFGGDAELALAGYNAGPERVDEWQNRYPTSNRMLFLDLIPFTETRNYVALITRNYFWYLSLYVPESIKPTGVPVQAKNGRKLAAHKPSVHFKALNIFSR